MDRRVAAARGRRKAAEQRKAERNAAVEQRQRQLKLEEKERHLFLFMEHYDGDISGSLYRIEVPKLAHHFSSPYSSNSSSKPQSQNNNNNNNKKKEFCNVKKEPEECLEPIIEFPYPEYPREMSCVELDSKLYFMGGHLRHEPPCFSVRNEVHFPGDFPLDVHVFDTTTTTAAAARLQKGCMPPMKTAKPFPYAFTANGCIFVYDNSKPYMDDRPRNSLFEVYQPPSSRRNGGSGGGGGEWIQLPNPPYKSVICGHAILHDKYLFLSCDCHVLCFDLHDRVWLKNYIHGIAQGHIIYGKATLLKDTLYAISGFNQCFPSAFPGFTPSFVEHHISSVVNNTIPNSFKLSNTDLLDGLAEVSASLEGVNEHVMPYDPSIANLVYLGNGCFCYARCGKFPDYHLVPKYEGIVLSYFAPYHGTFNEIHSGYKSRCFKGECFHSSHFKIKSSDPVNQSTNLTRCFLVSSNKKTPRTRRKNTNTPPAASSHSGGSANRV